MILDNKKGVTILELVISIAMLSVAVILMYGMFSNINKRKVDVESKTANLLKYYDIEQTIHETLMANANYGYDKSVKKSEIQLYTDYADVTVGSFRAIIKVVSTGDDALISVNDDKWTIANKSCYVDMSNSKSSGKTALIVIACQSTTNLNLIDYIKIPIYVPFSTTDFGTDCSSGGSCFVKTNAFNLHNLYCRKNNNSLIEGWIQSENIDFSSSNTDEVWVYIDSNDQFDIEIPSTNYTISKITQELVNENEYDNNIRFNISRNQDGTYSNYDLLNISAKRKSDGCLVDLGDIQVVNKKLTLNDIDVKLDKKNVKEKQSFKINLVSPIDTRINGVRFDPVDKEGPCKDSAATAGLIDKTIMAFSNYSLDIIPTVIWADDADTCEYEVYITTPGDAEGDINKKAGNIFIIKDGLCSKYDENFSISVSNSKVSQDQDGIINLHVDNRDGSIIFNKFSLSLSDTGQELSLKEESDREYTIPNNAEADYEIGIKSSKTNERIINESTGFELKISSDLCNGEINKTGTVLLEDHLDCLNATDMFSTTVEGIVSQKKEGTIKLNVVNNRSSAIKFSLDLSDDKNELVLKDPSEEYTVAAGANTTINVAVKSKKDIDTPITNSSTEYTLTINMQKSSTCGAVSISKTGTISLQDDSDKEPPSVTISNLTRLLNNNFYSGRVQLDYSATDQTGIDTLYFDVYKNNIKMYTATVNCNGDKSCSSSTSKTFCIFGNAANAANCNSTSLSHLDVSSSYNVIVVAYGKDTKGNMLNTTNITSYISNHEYNGSDLSALQTGCSALLMEDVRWYNMVTLIATNLNGSCSNAISHTGLATNQYLYKANTTSATCTITSKDGVYDSGLNQAICKRAYVPDSCSFNSASGYKTCSISRSNPQNGAVSSTAGCSCNRCGTLGLECKTSCGGCKVHGYEKGTITMDISKATGNINLNVSAIPSQAKNSSNIRYCYKAD